MVNPGGTPENLSPHPRPNISLETQKNPIQKFKRDFHKFSRKKVPHKLLALFDWCSQNVPSGNFNQIIEVKNMYKVIQQRVLPQQIEKAIQGEPLTKQEIDSFRLLKDIMVESHRLEHGDKKSIEVTITANDLRKQIFSDKRIISAKVVEEPKEEEEEINIEPKPEIKPEVKKEIIDYNQKKILIVGYPKSGKTTFSKQFKNVIHTDDYKDLDFKEQIYKILEDIEKLDRWIIEGVQGIRLFRKMLQKNKCLPNLVIYINPRYEVMDEHIRMRKMLDKVWDDCLLLNKNIEIKTIQGE